MDPILIVLAIPVFMGAMVFELWLGRRKGLAHYRFADSMSSLASGMGQQILGILIVPLTIAAYAFVYDRWRVHAFPMTSVLAWVLIFFAVDLCYYVFHRASHRVNFLWAGHIVHHQSEEYNLSTALRQSWFGQLFQWVFYIPLAFAGFPPVMFLTMTTLNTLYQFWIHTRQVGSMGPLEWVLNTPSHHRVHHGINPEYIDRNYAGILIIWDRLFGTFEPEGEEPAYGLVKPLASWNPLWANVHYWVEMGRMARASRSLVGKLVAFVGPPEWKPAELGGTQHAPPVDARTYEKFDPPLEPGMKRLVFGQFFVVLIASSAYLYWADGPPALRLGLGAMILVTLVRWGHLLRGTGSGYSTQAPTANPSAGARSNRAAVAGP